MTSEAIVGDCPEIGVEVELAKVDDYVFIVGSFNAKARLKRGRGTNDDVDATLT